MSGTGRTAAVVIGENTLVSPSIIMTARRAIGSSGSTVAAAGTVAAARTTAATRTGAATGTTAARHTASQPPTDTRG